MPKTLNDLMEFDCVVQVDAGGNVMPLMLVHAPELVDGELLAESWTLLDGFSGQQGYSGPLMHQSEFVGAGLETYILSHPGQYVTLVNTYTDPEDEVYDGTEWAIAFRPTPGEDALPAGYRWANEDDDVSGGILVPLTVDSTGKPYTQGEADYAVLIEGTD